MEKHWTETYNELMTEAEVMRVEARAKFGYRDCWGNRIANRKIDQLTKKAWGIQMRRKFGPPRFGTKRFDLFLTNV